MRLVLTSDNHWGHTERGNWANQIMFEEIRESVPDPFTLIIAGDLGNHERWHREDFLRNVRKQLPGAIIGGVLGNHDHWSWTKVPHFTVKKLIEENESYFKQASVNYLPKEPIQDETTYVCGFNGWYHDIHATKETAIPHLGDPLDGRQWLSSFAHREFGRCREEMKQAKARGQKTVLVTHMGFTEEAAKSDWKALLMKQKGFNPYFGGNPLFEDMLDDCDFLLYGHTHVEFDGLAKNGKTRVINAGSDYNAPRYKIIEV